MLLGEKLELPARTTDDDRVGSWSSPERVANSLRAPNWGCGMARGLVSPGRPQTIVVGAVDPREQCVIDLLHVVLHVQATRRSAPQCRRTDSEDMATTPCWECKSSCRNS